MGIEWELNPTMPGTNDTISSIKEYAHELLINDSDHLQLNGDSQQVAVYISG